MKKSPSFWISISMLLSNQVKRYPGKIKILGMTGVCFAVCLLFENNISAQFNDHFNSSTLDPAWTVVQTWPGGTPRIYGNTSPANHFSLTDNPGYLRYYLDPMTYHEGFVYDYATSLSYYYYDAGLEIQRTFIGDHWLFEAKGIFYLPYRNGRALTVNISFGDGEIPTYWVQMWRYADVNQNCAALILNEKSGSTWGSQTRLETTSLPVGGNWYYGPYNYPTAPFYFRLERDEGNLTAFWSDDGMTWNTAWTHDMGSSLDGLEQRVIINGLCWFLPTGSYADWDYVSVTETCTAPIITTCQTDITAYVNASTASSCNALVSFNAVASGVPLPTVKYYIGTTEINSPYIFPEGTTTVNVVANNGCGNDATCSFDVEVVDNTAPVATCKDITIQLDENGSATITAADIDGDMTVPQEIVPDANTVFLDHFNGSASGEVHGSLTYAPGLPNMGQAGSFGPGIWIKYMIPTWTSSQGTIEMWVKPESWGVRGWLLDLNWFNTNYDPPSGHVLYCAGGSYPTQQFGYNVWNGHGDGGVMGTTPMLTGEWIHLAFSWGPTVSKVYVNGVLDGFVNSNRDPALGNPVWAYLNYWGNCTYQGLIDEFHISKIQRTDEEILAHAKGVPVSSWDACGITSLEASKTDFTCNDIGLNTVALTVTDNSNNVSTCNATVSVVGILPSCEIIPIPGNGPYTGGDPYKIYLGYGPQNVMLSGSASGGNEFTYSWSGSSTSLLNDVNIANPVFTPTSEGKYQFTLAVTNEYGCTINCSITICVFDIRVHGSNDKVYVCHVPPGNSGNPVTLSISVNAVPAHVPGHAGDHLGTCGRSCDDLELKSGSPGEIIASDNAAFETVIHPNPFINEITITIESESPDPALITVYDLTGKIVTTSEKTFPNESISLGFELHPGIYIVFVKQGDQVQKVKIVKIK